MPHTSRQPPTIVLIEDDPAVAAAIVFALEAEGFDVKTFSSGTAALERWEPTRNACLVVDYGLPGMHGLDVIEQFRKRGVASPAILITARNEPAIRDRAAADGVPVVEKPFLGDELRRSVWEILAS